MQDSAANGTEATAGASNTVLFNPSPITATGGYLFETEYVIRNAVPENEKISGNANEVQDMGLDGVDIQITGTIRSADDDSGGSIAKLMTWMKESKKATNYGKGRFGLRMDDFPHFDMVPTSTYGYVLADIKFIRLGEEKARVGIVITLRFSGDADGWLTANGF